MLVLRKERERERERVGASIHSLRSRINAATSAALMVSLPDRVDLTNFRIGGAGERVTAAFQGVE